MWSEAGLDTAALIFFPLLVVLPYDNLSGDGNLEGVVDGAVEEITATLSRLRDVRVLARNTAYTFKGRHTDVRHE